ncbi:MAG: YlbF family regulator [Anaerolineae bacterium]|nr:YlbF family regulator [Anaerolineae bacterium]
MTTLYVNELEIASPAVVRQTARDFAAALAASPEFQALEEATATLQEDSAARQAMLAYQEKQRALQGVLMLGALSSEEQTELEQLRQAYLSQPAVATYLNAEAKLRTLCQQAGAALSHYIDFDFAAACGGGCC